VGAAGFSAGAGVFGGAACDFGGVTASAVFTGFSGSFSFGGAVVSGLPVGGIISGVVPEGGVAAVVFLATVVGACTVAGGVIPGTAAISSGSTGSILGVGALFMSTGVRTMGVGPPGSGRALTGVERKPVRTTVSEGFSGAGVFSGALLAAAVGPGAAAGAAAEAAAFGPGTAVGAVVFVAAGAGAGVCGEAGAGAGASVAPAGAGAGIGSTGAFEATGSSGLSFRAMTYPAAKQITPKPMATAMPIISWLELQSLPTGSRP